MRLAAVDGLIASHACGQVGQTQLESQEQLTHEDSTYIYNLCQYRYTMRHTQLGKDIQICWNIKMYGTKWTWSSMDALICNTSASVAFLKRFGASAATGQSQRLLYSMCLETTQQEWRPVILFIPWDFVLGDFSDAMKIYENWIRIWIHYHPLEHPLEHPLPKWKSMTHSPTMKIHGPFRPWIPPANWCSGCLTSSWGNVLNTTVGHKDATRGDLGREILWYLEMFIDVYRCLYRLLSMFIMFIIMKILWFTWCT